MAKWTSSRKRVGSSVLFRSIFTANFISGYPKQFNHEGRNYPLNRLKNHMKELKDIVVGKIENQNVRWYVALTHKTNVPNILTEHHFTFRMDVFTPFNPWPPNDAIRCFSGIL